MPKPKPKKNKVVRAWAVIGMEGRYKIFHWPHTVIDGKNQCEQYDIFLTEQEASLARGVWEKNWGGKPMVVPVEIKIITK